MARYFIARAKPATQFGAWRFDGRGYPGSHDFDFHEFYDPATGRTVMYLALVKLAAIRIWLRHNESVS